MKIVYQTKVTSIGGREGHVVSEDKLLNLEVSKPSKANNKSTNPEQLFGAGYAACFNSAMAYAASLENITYKDSQVTAEVKLCSFEDVNEGFRLAVTLHISLPELEDQIAWKLIDIAHRICPYSNAVRNNIDVKLELIKNQS